MPTCYSGEKFPLRPVINLPWTVGSCGLPQKFWADMFRHFLRLFDTDKQISKKPRMRALTAVYKAWEGFKGLRFPAYPSISYLKFKENIY